jgi:predicted transcriptional regulator
MQVDVEVTVDMRVGVGCVVCRREHPLQRNCASEVSTRILGYMSTVGLKQNV